MQPVGLDGAACDEVVYPVPAQYVGTDNHNWHETGPYWSNWHTGTDFSVPCGTTVYAAHAGTIEIDTTQGWAGPQLVKVTTGAGSLTTWYAHMQTVTVSRGQTVAAGEPIGQVGKEGNVSGCHLHFEVHLKNGSIYGSDNVDPSTWLAENASRPTQAGVIAPDPPRDIGDQPDTQNGGGQPVQRERRRDPYPWTWEIPAAVILATLFVIVIGIQLGRSVANLLAGAGWTWPARQRRRVPLPDRDRVLDQPARCPRRPRGRRPAQPDPRRPRRPRPGVDQPRPHRDRPADGHHLGRRLRLPALGTRTDARHGHRRRGREAPGRHPAPQGRRHRPTRPLRQARGRPEPVHRTAGDATEQPGPALGQGLSPWLLDRRLTAREER